MMIVMQIQQEKPHTTFGCRNHEGRQEGHEFSRLSEIRHQLVGLQRLANERYSSPKLGSKRTTAKLCCWETFIGHGIGGKVIPAKWHNLLKSTCWSKQQQTIVTRSHSHSTSDGSKIQVLVCHIVCGIPTRNIYNLSD